MSSLSELQLESNSKIKINFNGGDLSSDSGLLLIKELAHKIGLNKLIKKNFKTNDTAKDRFHKDDENLCQMIYQILAGYFNDNDADELSNKATFKRILEKSSLASQPTLSRFFNRMDEDTLKQFNEICKTLRALIYGIKRPEMVLLDLESTFQCAFIVTNMELTPKFKYYCNRGTMENFIKECKNGFDFASTESKSKIASKIIRSARYIYFKLCSSCPYQK